MVLIRVLTLTMVVMVVSGMVVVGVDVLVLDMVVVLVVGMASL